VFTKAGGSAIEPHEHAWGLFIGGALRLESVTLDETAHALLTDKDVAEIGGGADGSTIGDELLVHGADETSMAKIGVHGLVFAQEPVGGEVGFVESGEAASQSGAKVVVAGSHFFHDLFRGEAALTAPRRGILGGVGPDSDEELGNLGGIVCRELDDSDGLVVSRVGFVGGW
jgi:hypothetical protein